jgi:LmbE family N-acetylglucosaminyl deacetylase
MGGTLARAATEGHRVVIVVATDGLMDAAPEGEAPRVGELRATAAVSGAARTTATDGRPARGRRGSASRL